MRLIPNSRVWISLIIVMFLSVSKSDNRNPASISDTEQILGLNISKEDEIEVYGEQTLYQIFDTNGNRANMHELVSKVKNADVTFIGEIHTDNIAHHLEALLLEKTWDKWQTLSLEMFETDVQYVVDEYMAGHINEEHFIKSSRSWENYASDYRKLIEFSKEKGVPVIAANAPRRYVNMVRRLGKDSFLKLPEEGKRFLPPLPYPDASAEYAKKFTAIMSAHHSVMSKALDDRGEENSQKILNDVPDDSEIEEKNIDELKVFDRMLAAQNLWDSSMAWSIASYLEKNSKNRVLHVNGSFHTDFSLGIPEQLNNYSPNLDLLTVTIVPSLDYPNFRDSMIGLGDFIIITDGKIEPSH